MAEPWTDERIIDLRKHVSAGLSLAQIGAQMQITRNAVMGKAFRLGLVLAGSRKSPGWRPRIAKPANPANPRPEQHPSIAPDEPGMIKLVDLQHHHCRWPIGDVRAENFGFCGAHKMDGSSYCPVHHLRSSSGLPPKKARAA